MKCILILGAMILGLCAAPPVRAVTIDWGGSVLSTLVDSAGNTLDDSYVFELGSFGSFVPTSTNLDQWVANWKVFDRAEAPAGNGWNSAFSYFSSSATLLAGGVSSESPPLPAVSFAPNEQAFIFIYNSLSFDYLSEWALITNNDQDGSSADDWLFPVPGDKTDMPLEWRVSNASTVIYGGVNDDQGPGNYSVDPAIFNLQTHVVPEPAGVLLLGMSAMFGLCHRRRRA